MSNVIAFPKNAQILQAEAEEQCRTEMRMRLACICGVLTEPLTPGGITLMAQQMKQFHEYLDHYVAIRTAHSL